MNDWASWLDQLSRWVDTLLAALVPLLVLISFGLVLARYLFSFGSIGTQEAVLWLHSLIFMLGAAGTLRAGKHVRVDVLQQGWSARRRAAVDLAGLLLFLLPFCGFMAWISLGYVSASWAMAEGSREPGGLPAVYLLKSVIPLCAFLLAWQALAELLRAISVLRRTPAA